MREKQLDARLLAALELFPTVDTGADIGADHGYMTRALLLKNKARVMWATDISAPSLEKARLLMKRAGLSDRVRFGVGDGFAPLGEPVQAAAVMGMGGVNIQHMLLSQRDALSGCQLVLSANSQMESVRRALSDLRYRIVREVMTEAGGHFYPVLLAVPGQDSRLSERELLLGPCLTRQPPTPAYLRYLAKKRADWADEQGPLARQKQLWIMEEWERVHSLCTDDS